VTWSLARKQAQCGVSDLAPDAASGGAADVKEVPAYEQRYYQTQDTAAISAAVHS
jgi:hypothetical protein